MDGDRFLGLAPRGIKRAATYEIVLLTFLFFSDPKGLPRAADIFNVLCFKINDTFVPVNRYTHEAVVE